MRLSTGEPLAEEDVLATIAAAANAGITVFDTARAYGDNETCSHERCARVARTSARGS